MSLEHIRCSVDTAKRVFFLNICQLDISQFARHLGKSWTQSKISEIINGKRRITEAIDFDFSDAFATYPEFWLNLQHQDDLWLVKQVLLLSKLRYKRQDDTRKDYNH